MRTSVLFCLNVSPRKNSKQIFLFPENTIAVRPKSAFFLGNYVFKIASLILDTAVGHS